MKFFALLALCTSLATTAFAELDILPLDPESEELVFVLKNKSTGKVLGTFWNQAEQSSDFGFESSIAPEFVWSKDRALVAVRGGEARSTTTTLYQVEGETLKQLEFPSLDEQQMAPLMEIEDPVAEGGDPLRWQSDGTLLVDFWSAARVHSESEKQKIAHVWADIEVQGGAAKIVGTSLLEPSPQNSTLLPPNPAPSQPGNSESGEEASEEGFAPAELAGTHTVVGKNPNGSNYQGKVTIEIKVEEGSNTQVALEWNIAGSVMRGTGILLGRTVAVALEKGLVVYRVVGKAPGEKGFSLVGWWTTDGAAVSDETILIDESRAAEAAFPSANFIGKWMKQNKTKQGLSKDTVTITKGNTTETVLWEEGAAKFLGLVVGDGLGVRIAGGISVLSPSRDEQGANYLKGRKLTGKGEIETENLTPVY